MEQMISGFARIILTKCMVCFRTIKGKYLTFVSSLDKKKSDTVHGGVEKRIQTKFSVLSRGIQRKHIINSKEVQTALMKNYSKAHGKF